MTKKANNLVINLVINLLTAHAMSPESLNWRHYPLITIKNCNLSKDVVAEKIGDRWLRTPGIYKQVPPPGSLQPVLSGP